MTDREQDRARLKENLLKCKAESLRVFICKSQDYAYGIITDGTENIIYVQTNAYDRNLFAPSFEYVPSRKTGSCCSAVEQGYGYTKLSKNMFNESVLVGKKNAASFHATLYKNIDEFLADPRNKNEYIEL